MPDIRKALVIALILTLAATVLSAEKHEFQPGKLINIADDERLEAGTSYRWAIFTVQMGDLIITARGARIRRRSGDVGQGLVVGDAVQAAVDGKDLIILKPNGKDLKAKIIKRERGH